MVRSSLQSALATNPVIILCQHPSPLKMDEDNAGGGASNAAGNRGGGDDADLYGNDGGLEVEGTAEVVAAPPTLADKGSPWEQVLNR